MNSYFAVFNIQDKEKRQAARAFNRKFGKGSYQKHILPFVKQGIMSIFNKPPNNYTSWYINKVTHLVNLRVKGATK